MLGSNGANGGIKPTGSLSVPAVRLFPFLQSQYSQQSLDKICVLKIDTEGHDVVILADLPAEFRPPVILVEWFRDYRLYNFQPEYCSEESAQLFRTILKQGYHIFYPRWPLRKGHIQN